MKNKNMNGKFLTLIRGVCGAGKSTFARFIWNEHVICEADQFFVDKDGVYRFDGSKIKEAHKWCRDKVETMMKFNQLNPQYYAEIAVSNTFTQEWEMEEYYKLAEKYGYTVFSIIVENRHGGVNEHGVPDEKLEQMRARFSVKL
jgi:predicted kinase